MDLLPNPPTSQGSKSTGPARPKDKLPWTDSLGGTGNPDPDDWSQFDIRRVLRTLRMGSLSQCRMTLRKLHIRWWHATSQQMQNLLDKVGVPDAILQLIPPIVQTCKVCREWARPQPENVTNINLPDGFNAEVEADILFAYNVRIFHMIEML